MSDYEVVRERLVGLDVRRPTSNRKGDVALIVPESDVDVAEVMDRLEGEFLPYWCDDDDDDADRVIAITRARSRIWHRCERVLHVSTLPSVREALMEASMSGVRLDGADLAGEYLEAAALAGASLRGAIFAGANLHGANLHGADLTGADLTGADLTDTTFGPAMLSGACVSGAHCHGSDLLTGYAAGRQWVGYWRVAEAWLTWGDQDRSCRDWSADAGARALATYVAEQLRVT